MLNVTHKGGGGSTRRGQRTFPYEYYDDGQTWLSWCGRWQAREVPGGAASHRQQLEPGRTDERSSRHRRRYLQMFAQQTIAVSGSVISRRSTPAWFRRHVERSSGER